MNLGLVDTRIIERTYRPNNLPKKYFNLNFIIFIVFLLLMVFTLWYKYNQKQKKLMEQKQSIEKMDEEYKQVLELIEEENREENSKINEDENEYIDLDGWTS